MYLNYFQHKRASQNAVLGGGIHIRVSRSFYRRGLPFWASAQSCNDRGHATVTRRPGGLTWRDCADLKHPARANRSLHTTPVKTPRSCCATPRPSLPSSTRGLLPEMHCSAWTHTERRQLLFCPCQASVQFLLLHPDIFLPERVEHR